MEEKDNRVVINIEGPVSFKELAKIMDGIQDTFYNIADAMDIPREHAKLVINTIEKDLDNSSDNRIKGESKGGE